MRVSLHRVYLLQPVPGTRMIDRGVAEGEQAVSGFVYLVAMYFSGRVRLYSRV